MLTYIPEIRHIPPAKEPSHCHDDLLNAAELCRRDTVSSDVNLPQDRVVGDETICEVRVSL